MRPLLTLFATLAAIGLLLSFVSHILSLLGLPGPLGQNSWFLHIGIFVVWIPSVIVTQSLAKNASSREIWKAALRGCPSWMKYMTYGFFGYAVLNFLIFMFMAPPSHSAGGPGMPPSVVRGFSGHWMAFYCAAVAILYSKIQTIGENRPSQCPNGHQIGPFAKFCETCGSPVGQHPTLPK